MKTWRLVDGSTGIIDRSTNTVTREFDTWPVRSEAELLEILQRIAKQDGQDLAGLSHPSLTLILQGVADQDPIDLDHRAMTLESDNLSVAFGFGWCITYVEGSNKHPPYEYKGYFRAIREEDCESGRNVGFRLWQDDLLEFCGDKLIPWKEALKILIWIIRHDELPEWDEKGGCQPPSHASPESPPDS
jgi:hypothetical protein